MDGPEALLTTTQLPTNATYLAHQYIADVYPLCG